MVQGAVGGVERGKRDGVSLDETPPTRVAMT